MGKYRVNVDIGVTLADPETGAPVNHPLGSEVEVSDEESAWFVRVGRLVPIDADEKESKGKNRKKE